MHSWGRGMGREGSGAQASFAVAFTFDHRKFSTISTVSGLKPYHRKAEFLLREEIWILVKDQGREREREERSTPETKKRET